MLDSVRIEAVVTDLDGTVVRSDFSISPATLEAVDLLRSSGIAFVVATARTPQGLEHFQVLAERTDMGVCCSGAIGWSSRDKTRTWMDVMGPAVIRRIVDIAIAEGAGVASFDGTLWRMSEEYLRLSPVQPHGPTRAVVHTESIAGTPCCTMALRHANGDLGRIAALVADEADSAALSHVGRSTVLDVTAPGVDKGTGTARALLGTRPEPGAGHQFWGHAERHADVPSDRPKLRGRRQRCLGDAHGNRGVTERRRRWLRAQDRRPCRCRVDHRRR